MLNLKAIKAQLEISRYWATGVAVKASLTNIDALIEEVERLEADKPNRARAAACARRAIAMINELAAERDEARHLACKLLTERNEARLERDEWRDAPHDRIMLLDDVMPCGHLRGEARNSPGVCLPGGYYCNDCDEADLDGRPEHGRVSGRLQKLRLQREADRVEEIHRD